MSRLADALTIIVITQDRPVLLARAVDYLSRFGCRLIVADSSASAGLDTGPRHHVEYLHSPGREIHEKLAQALEKVDSPYCVVTTDDDFPVAGTYSSCVKFLDANASFSAVQGYYAEFHLLARKRVDFHLKYLPGYSRELSHNHPQETARVRIARLFENFVQWVYAVQRTGNLAATLNVCGELGNVPYAFYETIFGVVSAAGGRLKLLSELHCVRDVTPSMLSPGETLSAYVLAKRAQKKERYEALLHSLAKICAAQWPNGANEAGGTQEVLEIRKFLDDSLRRMVLQAPWQKFAPPRIDTLPFNDGSTGIRGNYPLPVVFGDVDIEPSLFAPILECIDTHFDESQLYSRRFPRPTLGRRISGRLARVLN